MTAKSVVFKNIHTLSRKVSSVSVVIPAWNEEKSIGNVLTQCHQVLNSLSLNAFEILVIDDGSTDGTAKIAHEKGATVYQHPANAGYGSSLKEGIEKSAHENIIILDADGTYPMESIPELLKKYESGFDLVIGKREGAFFQENLIKMPMRILLKFLVEFASGCQVPDINSGFRVFSKKDAMAYSEQLCNTFSYTTSQTLAYLMTRKYVTYVPIRYDKRVGKSKVRIFRDSLRTLQYIIFAILYFNPIKIFLLLASVCCLVSLLGMGVTLFLKIKAAAYIGIGAFLSALIIFSMGLVTEQLRQMMNRGYNI